MQHGPGLLVLIIFVLSGCALVDVNVKPPESGLEAPIPGGNRRQVIVTVPFQDSRQSKSRCGVQKGGFGNETASAVCVSDPAEWIASFLARELEASGFTVLRSEGEARDSALRIQGTLLQFFVEPVVGFWSTTVESDFNVRLVATSRTGLQAERTFFSKGELTSVIWTQGIFNDSVRGGLRDLLTQMVRAILELMNRYPELGLERRGHPMLVRWAPETAP